MIDCHRDSYWNQDVDKKAYGDAKSSLSQLGFYYFWGFCFVALVFSVKFVLGHVFDVGQNFEKNSQDSKHQGELEWTYQRNLGILSSRKDQFEVGAHEFTILTCLVSSAWQRSVVVHCCSGKTDKADIW